MEIKKRLEEMVGAELKGLLFLVLSEWMSKISREQEKENPKKYKSFHAHVQRWEDMVGEMYPALKEDSQKFFDWLVAYYGDELETYYLHGLCDGIRIFKWMMKV